jgi:hypothetical protein
MDPRIRGTDPATAICNWGPRKNGKGGEVKASVPGWRVGGGGRTLIRPRRRVLVRRGREGEFLGCGAAFVGSMRTAQGHDDSEQHRSSTRSFVQSPDLVVLFYLFFAASGFPSCHSPRAGLCCSWLAILESSVTTLAIQPFLLRNWITS